MGFSYAGFCQDAAARTFKFGGGIEVAAPANNMAAYAIGVGADLLGHYGLSDQIALTVDAGYMGFFVKKSYGDGTLSIIPIRGGIRYYPIQHVYVSGRAGVGIMTGGTSTTSVAFAFGGGYMVDNKLDLGLAYEGYGGPKDQVIGTYPYTVVKKGASFGYVGLRLGYFFK